MTKQKLINWKVSASAGDLTEIVRGVIRHRVIHDPALACSPVLSKTDIRKKRRPVLLYSPNTIQPCPISQPP